MVPALGEANMRATPGVTRSIDEARAGYEGPERRRHRVYVTRNTEYHFRDGLCVAVRDRRTGQFMQGHLALHGRIDAGITFFGNGSIAPREGEPRPGESLYFASEGRDLVTSPLESVERPTPGTVLSYPGRPKK
jgi:hypothetical protein